MSEYAFPGFTTFLEAAARGIGHPEAAGPARRISTLSALANLCAQAGTAGPQGRPEILAKAVEFRDQLRAAYEAAELMLSAVDRALGLGPKAPVGPAAVGPDAGRRAKRPSPPPGPSAGGGVA